MQAVKGIWRKFLGFLEGGQEEDDWDDDHDVVDYGYEYERDYEKTYDEGYDDGLDLSGIERRDRGRNKKVSNVVEFDNRRNPEDMTIVRIVRPKEMQDATLVCEYLQEKIICIVDMQGVDHVTAQRIADYLGGVSYALRGQVERIDNYIFVMAPESAKIDSDLREELKNGLFKSFSR